MPGGAGARRQNSTSSLNNSFIWREASPNSFNLYSSSISSLNLPTAYRHSSGASNIRATGAAVSGGGGGAKGHLSMALGAGAGLDYRALSEERATRKSLNRLKSGFGSGYDNIYTSPLLMTRKNRNISPAMVATAVPQIHGRSASNSYRSQNPTRQLSAEQPLVTRVIPGLYDRRLNRSFETDSYRYAGYGGAYMLGQGLKPTPLRRSTPQLSEPGIAGECNANMIRNEAFKYDDDDGSSDGQGRRLLHPEEGEGTIAEQTRRRIGFGAGRGGVEQKVTGKWCCGNFMMKQWRKVNNY